MLLEHAELCVWRRAGRRGDARAPLAQRVRAELHERLGAARRTQRIERARGRRRVQMRALRNDVYDARPDARARVCVGDAHRGKHRVYVPRVVARVLRGERGDVLDDARAQRRRGVRRSVQQVRHDAAHALRVAQRDDELERRAAHARVRVPHRGAHRAAVRVERRGRRQARRELGERREADVAHVGLFGVDERAEAHGGARGGRREGATEVQRKAHGLEHDGGRRVALLHVGGVRTLLDAQHGAEHRVEAREQRRVRRGGVSLEQAQQRRLQPRHGQAVEEVDLLVVLVDDHLVQLVDGRAVARAERVRVVAHHDAQQVRRAQRHAQVAVPHEPREVCAPLAEAHALGEHAVQVRERERGLLLDPRRRRAA